MLGNLNEDQIEEILHQNVIGRIGCNADGVTYVVPLNYIYDGVNIYAHSSLGMKIAMMRKNPDICFQVDDIQSMVNWRSVIAWGKYEELTDDLERAQAIQKFKDRMIALLAEDSLRTVYGATQRSDAAATQKSIWYRIVLNKKSGKFENG